MSKPQKIVRLTSDVVIDESCSNQWQMESTPTGWAFHCKPHGTVFHVHQVCPGVRIQHAAGSTVALPPHLAEHLVESGRAVYPTHESSENSDATIVRVNALLAAQGLPQVDQESMRTIRVKGARGRGHYQRTRDQRLAQDLGISGDDIDEIRRLSKG